MKRAIVALTLVAAALPLANACDKSGADVQARANEAQEQANREIGRANAQASEAQEEANRKIAGAQADFVTTREEYRHKVQTDLDALDQDIAALDSRAQTGSAKAKTDLQAKLPSIHAQRDAFLKDFRAIDRASATTFDDFKARLDKEWSDLKSAVDKAS